MLEGLSKPVHCTRIVTPERGWLASGLVATRVGWGAGGWAAVETGRESLRLWRAEH